MTFPNRKAEVVDLMGSDRRVVTIRFIPADQTRTALATIDPRARLGVISTFPEFLPIMKAGVQQFAPHVRRIEATVLESPDLKEVLRHVDAVVYASGSERVRRMIKPGVQAFEYRHAPDPHEIDEVLLPRWRSCAPTRSPRRASAAR